MNASADTHTLTLEHPAYPQGLRCWLGNHAPPALTLRGKLDIVRQPAVALFSSGTCPAALARHARGLADQLRQQGVTVISGFHSPVERACLTTLLEGTQPLIVCPARSIIHWRIPLQYRQPLQEERLLLLSPFSETQHRVTEETALTRNLVAAALAETVLVVHAAPGSKTGAFCRELLRWGKALRTFDSAHNANLIEMGAGVLRQGAAILE
jgi:predicted Rossmann fold nucleotide-binding protein DprA/Smf involved in DNA uptake